MNDKMSKNILRFGKYKGKSFEYVRKDSPSYFMWLWREGIRHKVDSDLYEYIKSNIDELKEEANNERLDFMEAFCGGEVCIPY